MTEHQHVHQGAGEGTESVHSLFARQAAATPAAPAVGTRDASLTYQELDRASGRLAHQLRDRGVRPGDAVAVTMPRGTALITALLAVLKCGAQYVAIEQGEPAERATAMLGAAGARLVLAGPEEQRHFPGAEVAVIDPAGESYAGLPVADPRPVPAQAPAYTAFTSGSTGSPKGVTVPHAAVVRIARANGFLPLSGEDTVLQLAPVAFDASTLEIWAPLLNGARLVPYPDPRPEPERVVEFVRAQGVTAMWLTAGLFHQVAERRPGDLRGLRHLLAGGDVLSPTHVNGVLAALPGLRLVNGYGPTENTTFTCCHVMTAPVEGTRVPIGSPVRGTQVHLLDAALAPVPDGQPGEVYAGGLGLAHGYAQDPALTAERFVPDPFSDVPGARLYRTGDLARKLPGGELEFLGRSDAQVKIRGFRVEPGEVETVLRRNEEVADCAVVVQGDSGATRRLAAFMVGEERIRVPRLRRWLAERLPGYLVPAVLQQVEALPLTGTGKVDRGTLAKRRSPRRPECDADFRAPGTGLEHWLTRVWADTLQYEEIGVDDDFFELGGHSLMATQITAEIADTHDVLVTARAFYEHPTVAELAGYLEDRLPAEQLAAVQHAADGREGAGR
ncbi:amino acid adenylation domain-containing protein [Streptomyces sp. 8N114]|uniref:amino acid adenylation domain-containing protein n=1 Tax=Streptomyces sp. 8N114 TaxID=3457419 RepID=UPI003FD16351